ncbi:hypothetical protein HGP16_04670 [Rhizobium sp. P40RR-XXII]|uniref:hypothetical protein n=1 Tax=unclassified Rhizobium TaxID=2613769 RepID=UPI0014568540|nr:MULTISPECIES: hypothetical protein [unclassified Rhizobium]NLR83435.1 hypothetical protein [Rhizobium sp. P28RR-XV]NLS15855.1 hypothetical protein [Rhizobium sp. P40RR-XXII]
MWKITRRSILILPVGALLSAQNRAEVPLPPDSDFPGPLPFTIALRPPGSDPEMLALMASFGEGEDQTKFIIEIQGPREKDGASEGSAETGGPISFLRGEFRHVNGSRPARFFEQLAKALAANAPSSSDAKLETLPFGIAFLGAATTRLPDGGFGGRPGDWYATKLFLGEESAEVYFNFNLVSGEAEFSMKDSDYGNTVLSELSKVIW